MILGFGGGEKITMYDNISMIFCMVSYISANIFIWDLHVKRQLTLIK